MEAIVQMPIHLNNVPSKQPRTKNKELNDLLIKKG